MYFFKCASECAFKALGIYTNDIVNRAELTTKFTNSLNGNLIWSPVLNSAIELCFKQAETKHIEFDRVATIPPSIGQKACHPITGFLLGCINMQLFVVSIISI